MDAVVRERPIEGPLAGSWWWDDGAGATVKITFESDDFAFGDADIALHVSPGSEMAQMFGSTAPPPAPGNAQTGGIHWGHAEVRKEIRSRNTTA